MPCCSARRVCANDRRSDSFSTASACTFTAARRSPDQSQSAVDPCSDHQYSATGNRCRRAAQHDRPILRTCKGGAQGPGRGQDGAQSPPEPTPKEKPTKPPEAPLNLKKRPDEQAAPASSARERGEGGRFASQAGPAAAGRPAARGGLPTAAPYRDPPQRMADNAKREWAAAPESVRGEVHRMQREFGAAYQRYRGDHEADECHPAVPRHGPPAGHDVAIGAAKLRRDREQTTRRPDRRPRRHHQQSQFAHARRAAIGSFRTSPTTSCRSRPSSTS